MVHRLQNVTNNRSNLYNFVYSFIIYVNCSNVLYICMFYTAVVVCLLNIIIII